ncbi:MAG: hypothetical protein R3A47_04665 [Polyangiales bacterium]
MAIPDAPIDKADDKWLLKRSHQWQTRNFCMFLIEPERGCHRGCNYCVMRRSTNNGMRIDIDCFSLVPEEAKRVDSLVPRPQIPSENQRSR